MSYIPYLLYIYRTYGIYIYRPTAPDSAFCLNATLADLNILPLNHEAALDLSKSCEAVTIRALANFVCRPEFRCDVARMPTLNHPLATISTYYHPEASTHIHTHPLVPSHFLSNIPLVHIFFTPLNPPSPTHLYICHFNTDHHAVITLNLYLGTSPLLDASSWKPLHCIPARPRTSSLPVHCTFWVDVCS